ncbi:MAG: acyl-CoA dehydrogenase family protein [Microvirga sp.]|nr:acyl-CoA dehydrogenase family protein [Microvirga sp.]
MSNTLVSDEIRMVVDTVRRFVREKVQPLEMEVEENAAIPQDKLATLKREAIDLGLYALNMPEEAGGGGLGTFDMCLVEEQLGQTSDALIRRIFGQAYPMLMACTPAQREKYLHPVVTGDKICAMAITEPGAGSDAASISTTARLVDGEWVLNGGKHFISDGDIADFTIVMALTDPEKRARGGITLFLVDKDTPGFSVARKQAMMGHRGYGHAELVFSDCRIPQDSVLGEVGGGFKLIMQSVSSIRLCHIGARCTGMAQRVLELMRQHAATRKQFGQPIGDFQMVQKMIADSAIEIYATRSMVLDCARDIDLGLDPRDKVSMIKVYASEMLGRVADRGIQVFGGYGFSKDLPLERIYRDARVTRIYDGTSEIHRMLIARSVIKNGLAI